VSEKYQVLARKYRPTNFSDLKGQEVLVKTISNAIKNNRVAHAFILSGIRGIGKTTSARIIARTINCTDIQYDESFAKPCMKCKNCLAYEADKHPDLIEIDAASKTGVNDIRELIDNSRYRPILGAYKIYIIDEVHMLSTSAFNALLKTLEEPPAHVKFIFATTELRKIPLTILSRCQRFDLRRLSKTDMVSHLEVICAKEGITISYDGLTKIAELSEGSVRDALSLMDQVYNSNNSASDIDFSMVCSSLGIAAKGEILDLFNFLISANIKDLLNKFASAYFTGMSPIFIVEELLNIINDVTKFKITGEYSLLSSQEENYVTTIQNHINDLDHPRMLYLWQVLFKGLRELNVASNQFACAEMLFMRACFITKTSDFIEIKPNTNNEAIKTTILIDSNSSAMSENHDETKVLSTERITSSALSLNNSEIDQMQKFREFVTLFRENHELIIYHSLYNDVFLVSYKEGELVFRQKPGVNHNLANQVAKLATEYTDINWKVRIVATGGEKTLSELDYISNEADNENVVQNELVQNVLNSFEGAKVKEIIKNDNITN
jgi:DNA polymerase-3 subunit gamma/tau